MVDITSFILEHRAWIYPLTIVFTFLEGETFVILVAASAAALRLNPVELGLCAWLGSASSDQCWFFASRQYGPWLISRSARAKAGIEAAHRLLRRWDTLFILTYRFMYGLRNISSIALGLTEIPIARFVILNTVAAGVWATTFVMMGLVFGAAANRLLGPWVTTIEITLALLLAVTVAGVWLFGQESRAMFAQLMSGSQDQSSDNLPQE